MKVQPKTERVLEDGWYPATATAPEEVETKFGERLIWKFAIEQDGETIEKVGFTSLSQSSRGNLVTWAKAILGEVAEGFDTDYIQGKPCQVFLEEFTDGEGVQKNKVTKVKEPKKNQKPSVAVEKLEKDFDEIPF